MPIVGITLDAERTYESRHDSDRGKDTATKWRIGTLDSRIFGMIRDRSTTMDVDTANPDGMVSTNINANEVAYETVQFGLRGWTNFLDGGGNEIVYRTIKMNRGGKSYNVVDPAVMSRIPQAIIMELAEEIRRDNEIAEVEGKN